MPKIELMKLLVNDENEVWKGAGSGGRSPGKVHVYVLDFCKGNNNSTSSNSEGYEMEIYCTLLSDKSKKPLVATPETTQEIVLVSSLIIFQLILPCFVCLELSNMVLRYQIIFYHPWPNHSWKDRLTNVYTFILVRIS